MWSRCMRLVKIRMSIQAFHQLPRHAAYKYEYLDGEAWLSPRPKTYHALLDLCLPAPSVESDRVTTRPVCATRLGRPCRCVLCGVPRPSALPRPGRQETTSGRLCNP